MISKEEGGIRHYEKLACQKLEGILATSCPPKSDEFNAGLPNPCLIGQVRLKITKNE